VLGPGSQLLLTPRLNTWSSLGYTVQVGRRPLTSSISGMRDSLAEDAIALVGNKSRAILGIAGSPGVGKSTLVEQLLVRIRAIMGEQWAAHVPMDGFHLADVQLERLGVRDRKGAPETFDADGYAHLLLSTTAVKADRIIVNDAAGPFVSE
jgi:pantothenate kinase